MKKIKLFLFDIGNVIISFDHMITCRKLAKCSKFNADQIYNMLFNNRFSNEFEKGEISSVQFFEKVKNRLDIDISFKDFYLIWGDIFSLNKGITKLIENLKKQAKIFAMSNTDPMHFNFFVNKYKVFKYIEKFILSFEIGCRKPDKKIYQIALEYSGLPAEKIILVDDIEENVRAFKKMGGNGIIFRGTSELKKALNPYGFKRWK